MLNTRKAAVAGAFYPADINDLRSMIDALLEAAGSEGDPPKALIVPHAGYVYSGPIAATAYARLKPQRHTIKRVVLLGPAHRVPVSGLATSSADYFETPLGKIPCDREAINAITDLSGVGISDAAHHDEHSLEVHLPFLQRLFDDFKLVALVVGDADPALVGEVLERLWGGPETLIVISSDLSHFYDYNTAQRLDGATANAIETLRYEDIGYEDACGRNPVNGLLYYARRHGRHIATLDLRNSGDTSGDKHRVVGYGAFVMEHANPNSRYTASDGQTLIEVAKQSIKQGLETGQPSKIDLGQFPKHLREERAAFVTLHKQGALRGCIGSLSAKRPLVDDVAHNAFAAAFSDPRFSPVRADEFDDLDVHISTLSVPQPLAFTSEQDLITKLRPGIDGLILQAGSRRGTFLPSVWENLADPVAFLKHLKLKAGLSEDYWSDDVRIEHYTTQSFP